MQQRSNDYDFDVITGPAAPPPPPPQPERPASEAPLPAQAGAPALLDRGSPRRESRAA